MFDDGRGAGGRFAELGYVGLGLGYECPRRVVGVARVRARYRVAFRGSGDVRGCLRDGLFEAEDVRCEELDIVVQGLEMAADVAGGGIGADSLVSQRRLLPNWFVICMSSNAASIWMSSLVRLGCKIGPGGDMFGVRGGVARRRLFISFESVKPVLE